MILNVMIVLISLEQTLAPVKQKYSIHLVAIRPEMWYYIIRFLAV
jgi:hypothetical protein